VILKEKTSQNHPYGTDMNKTDKKNVKSRAVPLPAWCGPEGSRKLRFPDFMTTA
jgi:hypothetical protein